ncbi:uncharacterized protein TNCV_4021351 [Trichonephila clavipes]|nr:uncharacterized protein TNCV_4021351 [Trichonephila clavipes]
MLLWGGKLLRNYPPTNNNTLIRALTEEWDKLPQQLLDNVVQSAILISGPLFEGCRSPVVKVSDHGRHVMSSSPVPLKIRRVGQRCMLNLSRAETSTRWCGVVVRRGGCQLRCRPRHMTMAQNYVVRLQKPSCT